MHDWTVAKRLIWLLLVVAVTGSGLISAERAGAQGQAEPGDVEVVVRISLDRDEGEETGQFVIAIDPVTHMPNTISLEINFDESISPVVSDDDPTCTFGAPWVGVCGPSRPTDQLRVAAFTSLQNREIRPEIVASLPVTFASPDAMTNWSAGIVLLTDVRGIELKWTLALETSVAQPFVSIVADCEARAFDVQSSIDIVSASVRTEADDIATPVPAGDGIWTVTPQAWSAVMVISVIGRDEDNVESTYTHEFVNPCDRDSDGITDWDDNCADSYNPSQADFDDNGIGDSCDGTVVNCGNGLFRVATSHAPTLESLIDASSASICWAAGGGGPNFVLSLALIGLDPEPAIDLTALTALTHLEIVDSGLTTLPTGVTSLDGLLGLGLPGNALSDLPAEIRELENLTTLTLADNEFVNVPVEAWTMPGLRRLDLSGNQLTSLPPGVNDGLQQLDLRDNQLAGDLTAFLDTWYLVDRDHDDDAFLGINDGPGGNDCVTTTNPDVSSVWGLRRLAFECGAQVPVEGRVLAPDGATGVFGAEVCAERPLLETLCVFTDVFGFYRFDDVGQGNYRFSVTDPAMRYEAPPTHYIGVVATEEALTIDFETFFVGLGGVDPGPEPTPEPTPGPEPTPTPPPTPTPTPEPPSATALAGTISGRVLGDLGGPLAGGQVCADMVLIGTGSCTTTDGTGRFFLGGLPAGNYVVTLSVNDEVVDAYQYASVSATQGVAGIELRDN